jgi:O-antigen/teichoic acid export membrane protein
MKPLRKLATRSSRVLLANVGARVAALVSLALATALVAWTGGPAAVGVYALVRVLPGLVGVVMSSGLPGALTYFLAGPSCEDRRLPLTIVAMTVAGGVLGTALWSAATPLLGAALFPDLSTPLVLLAGATVLTQLPVATAKSCSQGSDDLPGANLVIVNEELMFLPAYGLLWAGGIHGDAATVTALLLADVATFAWGWLRLARRGFFRGALQPSLALARRVGAYGMRGQVGGVMTLLNLRLDFILLQLLAGPAVLGVYAIASKFAELVKVPGMALTYVLYPRFAREGKATAAADARRLMPPATLLTTGVAVALLAAASAVIPALYGAAFEPAVVPAQVILVGLALDGLGGVISGFLYGVGRPGLNSWAMAAGLLVTVALDVILIPPYGATGAAVASAVAYVTSTLALVWFYWWVGREARAHTWEGSTVSSADAR